MMLAEATLLRVLRPRLRKRPRLATLPEWTFGDHVERMKLAGLARAIRVIRRETRR